MDLAPYRRKYGRFLVERRDWPVSPEEFERFRRHGTAPAGAAALIWNRRREILLVREGVARVWTTPGGFAKKGETPESCVIREAEEEAGVRIAVTELTKVVVCYVTDAARDVPFTFFQFEAKHLNGRARPGKDVAEAAWWDRLPADLRSRPDYVGPWLRSRPHL